MSLLEPFLQQALFKLDAFTNWRHYKYLGFKANRITCGQGYTGRVTTTQKVFSAFPSVLVTDTRRDTMEGRGCSPRVGISLSEKNRNTPSIVDHILFF
jgi:hypothetical protein